MKIIQEISERTMVANIQSLLETYPVDPSESYLSITGGYALNCPTNSKLMKEFGFRGFTSPPCVSDCGISYGIGLMMFYLRNPNFHFKLQNAFYGETSCFDQKVQTEFNQYIESIAPLDESIFVQDPGRRPGWWLDGEAEIGPRGLGAPQYPWRSKAGADKGATESDQAKRMVAARCSHYPGREGRRVV